MDNKFSDRIGETNVRSIIQIDDIDAFLATSLWNTILEFYIRLYDDVHGSPLSDRSRLCQEIWVEFFHNRIDRVPNYPSIRSYSGTIIEFLSDWFFSSKWFEKYNLIEFLCQADVNTHHSLDLIDKIFVQQCNAMLEKHLSAFRIVNKLVVPITSENEITSIQKAIEGSEKWGSVQTHLNTALFLLSSHDNPDYRNSVKESISAIESLCKAITGKDSATFGQLLGEIEKKLDLHGGLRSGFAALYGFTSDAGGIRHALLEKDAEIKQEDAVFMLVLCTAFFNYISAKMDAKVA